MEAHAVQQDLQHESFELVSAIAKVALAVSWLCVFDGAILSNASRCGRISSFALRSLPVILFPSMNPFLPSLATNRKLLSKRIACSADTREWELSGVVSMDVKSTIFQIRLLLRPIYPHEDQPIPVASIPRAWCSAQPYSLKSPGSI